MYTKLLEETIRELRGEEIEDDARATVNLRVDLKIDEDYIQDMNQRLMVYRKVASARTRQELDTNARGHPRSLWSATELGPESGRVWAGPDSGGRGRRREHRSRGAYGRHSVQAQRQTRPDAAREGRRRMAGCDARAAGVGQAGRRGPDQPRAATSSSRRSRRRADRTRQARDDSAGSWWTARATAGEVRPGFSKDEILRKPESDPRAEGGMFSRLVGLLQALGPEGQSF